MEYPENFLEIKTSSLCRLFSVSRASIAKWKRDMKIPNKPKYTDIIKKILNL